MSKEVFSLSEQEEADVYSADISRCGLGGFQPGWLQKFRSSKSYVLVYGLLGMNQFALGSYMVGTLSTVEKQFKISSRTSGEWECDGHTWAVLWLTLMPWFTKREFPHFTF